MSDAAVNVERLRIIDHQLGDKGLPPERRGKLTRERDRLLSDDATRAAWRAAQGNGAASYQPGSAQSAADPLGDPAEAELRQRLAAARALIEGLRPITSRTAARFLEPDAVEAAALLREHDRPTFWRLTEELRPFKILALWNRAIAAVARLMADGELKIAEKTRLIAIAIDQLELWHDGAEAWCFPKEQGPGCCWRMPSAEVKRHLIGLYGEQHQITLEDGSKAPMAPGRQGVAEALDQLEAMAHRAPRRAPPSLRVGGDGARLVLDLCRDDHTVVVATAAGWEVVKPSPLAMRRADGMQPLPLPVQGAGDALADLRALLGWSAPAHDHFWAMVVGFMFAALRPVPPYFVLCLAGEQGAGKTSTARIIRAPVDPHDVDTQDTPEKADDLYVNADGQWLTVYDNLEVLSRRWSAAFCRISTGTGYSKKKLYTDRDTARFKLARPMVITAITDVVGAPDLLDRSLLAQQPDRARDPLEDELLHGQVAELAPRILGQLLDAAVVALRDQRKVKLSTVPRMVGPTKWIEAAAEVLGLELEAFLDAYLASQSHAGEMALEASLIGAPLVDMLEWRDARWLEAEKRGERSIWPLGFEGNSKQLLADLTQFMRDHARPLPGRWPQTPKGMNSALRRIAPALRKIGHVVEFARGSDATHGRIVTVDTDLSYARRSAHNGIDRPNRPNRPKQGAGDPAERQASDGSDGSDGCSTTQTNGGHSRARENGPKNVASVAFMITNAIKAELRAAGFSAGQISEMKPEKAHDHLNHVRLKSCPNCGAAGDLRVVDGALMCAGCALLS